jgi:hypothetical protein
MAAIVGCIEATVVGVAQRLGGGWWREIGGPFEGFIEATTTTTAAPENVDEIPSRDRRRDTREWGRPPSSRTGTKKSKANTHGVRTDRNKEARARARRSHHLVRLFLYLFFSC